MNNDFNTTLAAMSAEEKVALLTGSGRSLPLKKISNEQERLI